MLRNALSRLLQSILVLLGVALLIFLMLRIIPGNPIAVLMGEHVDIAAHLLLRPLSPTRLSWRFWRLSLRGFSGLSAASSRR